MYIMFKKVKRFLSSDSKTKGFTLIELLVVIAVIGALAGGILILSDPVDRINSANDVKAQNGVAEIGRAADAFAVRNIGAYASDVADLANSGELKSVPAAPSGYAYTYTATNNAGDACTTAAGDCTIVVITSPLKSRKHQATPYQRAEVSTAKVCQVAAPSTACP